VSEKTELPTPKKLQDSARKGQTFKATDLNGLLTLLACTGWLAVATDLSVLLEPMRGLLSRTRSHSGMWPGGLDVNPMAWLLDLLGGAVQVVLPLLLIAVTMTTILVLWESRFELATEALKPSFERIDPIKVLGRMFSLRTVKELATTLAYCTAGVAAVTATLVGSGADLFALVWLDPRHVQAAWQRLAVTPLLALYGCLLPICLLDALAEYRLHVRDQRMEKREVLQEQKDQEGSPELRAKRRDLRQELLDEQTRSDIAGSNFIAANPTHIAIGIYINEARVAWPFVSVRETNRRALAVIAYAESIGVPVIRNVRLARALYRGSARYGFVDQRVVDEVLLILAWLSDVERAGRDDRFVQAQSGAEP
jgi:type III secretion system export apparatus switch protein